MVAIGATLGVGNSRPSFVEPVQTCHEARLTVGREEPQGEDMKFLSVMPNLYVADVEASAAFYRDLLGGTETFRLPAAGPATHVELRIGDVIIAVSSRDEVAPQGLPEPSGGHPLELVVWCDSADEAVAALRAAGVPVVAEPSGGHVSGLRRGYVADPDGNWIALVSETSA
jgi:lactoylglutathione lyase